MPLVSKSFSDIITFTRASSGTYFDATGTLQNATTNNARFDYDPSTLAARGMLVEEQRTNSIRNNTMQGAVAGTPGTSPTNWVVTGAGDGVAIQVVGTGTENGITYIDIRYFGTATANSFKIVRFEAGNNIVAVSGQSWTASTYMRIAAGSSANISSQEHVVVGFTAAGGVSESTNTPPSLTSTMTRFTTSRVLNNATTAFVSSYYALTFNNGAAIDITLRIGLPQLEQGAFATSVISTTTAAATRSADVASVNTLSPWYNASAGTLYAEGAGISDSNARYIASINDGGINEFYGTRTNTNLSSIGIDGGSTQWALVNSYTSNNTFKSALAYAANDIAFTTGGAVPVTDATATLPTVTQMQIGTGPALSVWCGYIRRITYYPRRLSNAELQGITT